MLEWAVTKVVRGTFEASALVSQCPLSFFGEVDASTGIVVGVRSDLHGQSLSGKALCLPRTYGSNGSWRVLQLMARNGCGPAALVIADAPDPSVVQGAILAGLPIVRLAQVEAFTALPTHATLRYSGTGVLQALPVLQEGGELPCAY